MSSLPRSEIRAYVITARDVNGNEYHLGDGVPLVILADWATSPRDILDRWLATCSESTRGTLARTASIRQADCYRFDA